MKFHQTIQILLLTLILASCGSTVQQNKDSKLSALTVDEFEKKMEPNAQIIDVRTPKEYGNGFIKNALNIDWNGTDFEASVLKLDKSKPTLVYCLSGGRSHQAALKLESLGFKEVYELDKGFLSWKNSGKKVEIGAENVQGMSLEDYKKQVGTDQLVLVDFNAPWCAPCKKMNPILEALASDQKNKLHLLKIDVDQNELLAKELNISSIPLLILFKNGKEVWKKNSFTTRQELEKVLSSI